MNIYHLKLGLNSKSLADSVLLCVTHFFSFAVGSVLGAGRTQWSEEGGGMGDEHRVKPGQKLDEGP